MDKKQHASLLRSVRKIHRATGIALFFLFLFVALSGLLLGWKKNSGGYILPASQQGTSTELEEWLPLDTLSGIAIQSLQGSVGKGYSSTLSRIDARPDKGMVKFVFEGHYWEVQLDGATGEVLQVALRRSDFLEQVHDGSIIDEWIGLESGFVKLLYTSLMGVSLILFSLTGFWLWYGPKRMRKMNKGQG